MSRMTEETRYARILYTVGRVTAAVLPYLLFLGISYLISILCAITTGGSPLGKALSESFLSFFLLYSTSRIATIGDPALLRRFAKGDEPLPASALESAVFFLRDRETHLELGLLLGMSLLLPVNYGLFVMGDVFFSSLTPYPLQRLVTVITAAPLCLLAHVLGSMSAIEYWRHERKKARRFPLLRSLIEYVGVSAVYLLGAYITPAVLSMLGGIALMLLSVPALFLAWLLLSVLRLLKDCLRVLRARRRLYRRLRAISRERGYTLTKPHALYRSILFPRAEINFTVKVAGDEIYDCLVLSTLRKRRFLFFNADGIVTAVAPPRRGTAALTPIPRPGLYSYYVSAELFALLPNPPAVSEPYAFASGNRKMVIVTPAVWRWYLEEGSTRQIEPGAGAWGYKFYNAETVLGLLERGSLGRDWNRR